MDFKTCEYYEDSMAKGHCPFDKNCKDDCYFTLKQKEETFEYGMQEENEDLKRQIWDLENKIDELEFDNDLQDRIDELEEENEKLKSKVVALTTYCTRLIEDLEKYEKVEVPDEIIEAEVM